MRNKIKITDVSFDMDGKTWYDMLPLQAVVEVFNEYVSDNLLDGFVAIESTTDLHVSIQHFNEKNININSVNQASSIVGPKIKASYWQTQSNNDVETVLKGLAQAVFMSQKWSELDTKEDVSKKISVFQNDLYQLLSNKLAIPYLSAMFENIAMAKQVQPDFQLHDLLMFTIFIQAAGSARSEIADLCNPPQFFKSDCTPDSRDLSILLTSGFGKLSTSVMRDQVFGGKASMIKDGIAERSSTDLPPLKMMWDSWAVDVTKKITQAIHSDSHLIQKDQFKTYCMSAYTDVEKANKKHDGTTDPQIIFVSQDDKVYCKFSMQGFQDFKDIIVTTHDEVGTMKVTEELYNSIVSICNENVVIAHFYFSEEQLEEIWNSVSDVYNIVYGKFFISDNDSVRYKFTFVERNDDGHVIQECAISDCYHRYSSDRHSQEEIGSDIMSLVNLDRKEMLSTEGQKMFATLLWDLATGSFFIRGQSAIAMYAMKSIALSKDIELNFSDEWTPPHTNYDMHALSCDRQEFIDNEFHNIHLTDLSVVGNANHMECCTIS